ncbi:DUF1989 domain-containing protein [Pseudomonas typographi]|uniref:DUF1989 domain-containing protein n=1 Tax=Pseudomonas typographi TaxID=2715964 RepID=UPI001682B80F|nr:urea carboxylase-associated family protein [Pseudomonas typographi]MBD1552727.1 urea carboxylase-associated family protein [Pseudomonas typographi]
MPPVIIPVAARTGYAVRLAPGDRIDVVNSEGAQVVDTWAFALGEPYEYLSMEHSRVAHYRLAFEPGDLLYTQRWRPILRFMEDRSPGVHDTLCPACCAASYVLFDGYEGYHANCTDNLQRVLAAEGRALPATPTPWNLFMHTVVEQDRVMKDYPSQARPGDYVSLRAEMNCLFAVSACPQDIIPINGVDARPRGIELRHTSGGY